MSKLQEKTKQEARALLKEFEGSKLKVYDDGTHIPTIGTGFALLIKNSEGKYKIRNDLDDLKINLNSNDIKILGEFKDYLNGKKSTLPELEKDGSIRGFEFTLTSENEVRILDATIDEAARKVFASVGNDRWESLTEGQKMGLISFAFKTGSIKNLAPAAKDGDFDKVASQIRNSVPPSNQGAYSRAQAEANLIEYGQVNKPGTLSVKGGDSFVKIAQKAGVTVEELKKLNPDIKDINRLSIGQEIKLPEKLVEAFKTQDRGTVLERIVEASKTQDSSTVLDRIIDAIANAGLAHADTLENRELKPSKAEQAHIVERGDSLSKIAKEAGTTVQELLQDERNAQYRQNPDRIMPGQVVHTPDNNFGSSRQTLAAEALKDRFVKERLEQNLVYEIQRGDTLSQIARDHGVKVRDIMAENSHIRDANKIRAGDDIRIPIDVHGIFGDFNDRLQAAVEPMRRWPIALDLDGNGLNLISLNQSTAKFDLNSDGITDHVEWVSGDDALLAYDYNQDGIVSETKEIVLTEWSLEAKTDFDALLKYFDSNQDGKFDARDKEFSKFVIWRDKNQNGISEKQEITPVVSLIEFFNLNKKEEDDSFEFTYKNQTIGLAYDVFLQFE